MTGREESFSSLKLKILRSLNNSSFGSSGRTWWFCPSPHASIMPRVPLACVFCFSRPLRFHLINNFCYQASIVVSCLTLGSDRERKQNTVYTAGSDVHPEKGNRATAEETLRDDKCEVLRPPTICSPHCKLLPLYFGGVPLAPPQLP